MSKPLRDRSQGSSDKHVHRPYRATQSGTFLSAPRPKVLTLPDPRLAQRSSEVDPRDPAIVAVARLLVSIMSESTSLGASAPQIGRMLRVLCVDVTGHPEARSCAGLIVLANPRIVRRAGNVVMVEECSSVPHFTGPVARAETVLVEGDLPGTPHVVTVAADGIEARTLLHEIDHLDGFVFPDRMLEASAVFGPHTWYA
jgi:peptide deformylase